MTRRKVKGKVVCQVSPEAVARRAESKKHKKQKPSDFALNVWRLDQMANYYAALVRAEGGGR